MFIIEPHCLPLVTEQGAWRGRSEHDSAAAVGVGVECAVVRGAGSGAQSHHPESAVVHPDTLDELGNAGYSVPGGVFSDGLVHVSLYESPLGRHGRRGVWRRVRHPQEDLEDAGRAVRQDDSNGRY